MSRLPAPASSSPVTVLIVDAEPLTRYGLQTTLDAVPGMQVIGQASGAEEALPLAVSLKPHLMTTDLELPGLSGLELVQRLYGRQPSVRSLVLMAEADARCVEQVLQAGAFGAALRTSAPALLIDMLQAIHAGHYALSPPLADVFLGAVARSPHLVVPAPADVLSPRELQVYELIGHGWTVRDIADRLDVSVTTVESYRRRAQEKLSIESTTELMRHAVRWATPGRVCYHPPDGPCTAHGRRTTAVPVLQAVAG